MEFKKMRVDQTSALKHTGWMRGSIRRYGVTVGALLVLMFTGCSVDSSSGGAPESRGNSPATTPAVGMEGARVLSGSASSLIEFVGGAEQYLVTVGADQLLEVSLTTASPEPVSLRYTITGGGQEQVAAVEPPGGVSSGAPLRALHALPKAGEYIIEVTYLGGGEDAPALDYTISAEIKPELDPQEIGGRNDTPATATRSPLGTKTFRGQIGSASDVDFFMIEGLEGISSAHPAVMEVTLHYDGAVLVDPSIAYIFPASGSPCTEDACCGVLQSSCSKHLDCRRTSFRCLHDADDFNATPGCSNSSGASPLGAGRCAGAGVCLSERALCGAEQVVLSSDDGGDVITSQLLIHPGPWYVRISDLDDDEYAHGVDYTLTIRVRMDPDGSAEPDNVLLPDRCQLAGSVTIEELLEHHLTADQGKVREINWGDPVTGYLSYEGDMDLYQLPNPCPDEDCIVKIEYSTGPDCPVSGAPVRQCDSGEREDTAGLEFLYALRRPSGKPFATFKAEAGESGCIGDCGVEPTCIYSPASHGSAPYLFTVADLGFNSWSWACSYTFTLSVTRPGCQSPCTPHPVSGICTTP